MNASPAMRNVSDLRVIAPDPHNLLNIDRGQFLTEFDRSPFLIDHNLCGHPLFEIDRLLELARSLPAKQVEYNAGELPIGLDPALTPRNGMSAEETIRRLEEYKSWMVLKNVEVDPDFQALLDRCMAEVAPLSETIRPGMQKLEAFVFLSSPGAVTPYHMDPEHNFLLQIRGEKRMTLFDRKVVNQEQLERFYCGAHRNMPYDEAFLANSQVFDLPAGKGIHVPVAAPHYVVNGKGVSVSFSITFRTPDLERTGEVHAFNARLRKLGLNPIRAGVSAPRDQLKSLALRAWRKSLRIAGVGEAS